MKPRLDIRAFRPDERDALEPLRQGHLSFYKSAVTPDVTDTTWGRLHDPGRADARLRHLPRRTLPGIVHYLFHRSTWTIGDYCYPQDLLTTPQARGQSAGRALIEAVYDRA